VILAASSLPLASAVALSNSASASPWALARIALDLLAILNREFDVAARLIGDNPEMGFWHATGLLAAGKNEPGIEILREVATRDRNWITLALRLPAVLLPPNPAVIEEIRTLA
jgi:hypothetical protein